MRLIKSTVFAAGLLSLTLLAGCGDATNEAEADAAEAAADEAADDEAVTLPDDVTATIEKADACRALAEEADASSMAAVQDRWDEAGCETLGADLEAARAAHPEDDQVALALDYASRPIGEE